MIKYITQLVDGVLTDPTRLKLIEKCRKYTPLRYFINQFKTVTIKIPIGLGTTSAALCLLSSHNAIMIVRNESMLNYTKSLIQHQSLKDKVFNFEDYHFEYNIRSNKFFKNNELVIFDSIDYHDLKIKERINLSTQILERETQLFVKLG